MQLFGSYLDVIRQAIDSPLLQKGHKVNARGLNGIQLNERRAFDAKAYELAHRIEPTTSMTQLAKLLDRPVKLPKTGDHPDFRQLRNAGSSMYEYHYITSVFMDVKNSTSLFRRYTLEQIPVIIQAIVTAATHTCALFDGHIQRMQYDGVFAYFGGKGVTREQAVHNAINAATFFTYFVKYELPTVFEALDIEKIFTRTGIDFGDDNDTLWSVYGTGDCTELTTTSLHTSLAPKMQQHAESNGIMVGDNVKKRLGVNDSFCDLKKDDRGNIDENQRYIFKDSEDRFYYTQHRFLWEKYLVKTYDFVKVDDKRKLFIDYNPNISDQELRRQQQVAQDTRDLEAGRSSLNPFLNVVKGSSGLIVPRERNYFDDTSGY